MQLPGERSTCINTIHSVRVAQEIILRNLNPLIVAAFPHMGNLLRWAVSLGCSLLDPAATFQKSGIEWGSLPLDPLTLSECREGKWELACRMQKGTVLSSPVLLITGGDPLFSYKKVGKGEKKVKLESLSFSAVRWATRCANWRLSIWD